MSASQSREWPYDYEYFVEGEHYEVVDARFVRWLVDGVEAEEQRARNYDRMAARRALEGCKKAGAAYESYAAAARREAARLLDLRDRPPPFPWALGVRDLLDLLNVGRSWGTWTDELSQRAEATGGAHGEA